MRDKAFFPVEKRGIYTCHNGKYAKVPNRWGIYDVEKQRVLGIVSDSYKLVTNEDAYRLAEQLMAKVFIDIEPDDLECFNIVQPATRSFCHIDLVHRNRPFMDPFAEGDDGWVAFMRVTNSYNRTWSLRYQMGFCRWICENGIIFGGKDKRVEFKFNHMRDELVAVESDLVSSGNIADIRALESRFLDGLRILKEHQVRKTEMLPLLCRALGIKAEFRTHEQPKRAENLIALRERVNDLTEKYVSVMGENAYAALNVITDFARDPVHVISRASSIDGLQRKAGDWMDGFLLDIKDEEFSNADYVADYRDTVGIIEALPNQPETAVTA